MLTQLILCCCTALAYKSVPTVVLQIGLNTLAQDALVQDIWMPLYAPHLARP